MITYTYLLICIYIFYISGHVSSTYVERLKGVSLVVRSEADGSLLLESKVKIPFPIFLLFPISDVDLDPA